MTFFVNRHQKRLVFLMTFLQYIFYDLCNNVEMILQEPSATLRFSNWDVKSENGSNLQRRFGMTGSLTKGLTWNQYPLDVLQSFNYKPLDTIIYTKSGNCQDDPKQNDVTCKWY